VSRSQLDLQTFAQHIRDCIGATVEWQPVAEGSRALWLSIDDEVIGRAGGYAAACELLRAWVAGFDRGRERGTIDGWLDEILS
jgi:hypothetical protein